MVLFNKKRNRMKDLIKCYCNHTTTCDCGPELDCKDCSQSLEDCTCIEDTLDMKQSTKDRILSETSEEIKQRVRETANKLVMKQEHKKNFYCGDEVDYEDKCLEQCENCNDATGVDYGYIEDAALINYKKLYEGEPLTQDVPIDAFKQGVKWQKERSYSEEELKSAFKVGFSIGYGSDVYAIDEKNKTCDEWFEQFKKN